MDRDGWIDDVCDALATGYQKDRDASSLADLTAEAQLRDQSKRQTMDILRSIASSSDMRAILRGESTLLRIDHFHEELSSAPNSRYLGNLRKSIDNAQIALAVLDMIADSEAYRAYVRTFPLQDIDRSDLPLDACRKFAAAHPARLENFRLAQSDIDKAILKQRTDNIKLFAALYKSLQRETLGDDWRPKVDLAPPSAVSRE